MSDHDLELPADRSRLPEIPPPDDPDQPVFDFGPRYRKPYCTYCRYCHGVHLTREEWTQCQKDTTGGW